MLPNDAVVDAVGIDMLSLFLASVDSNVEVVDADVVVIATVAVAAVVGAVVIWLVISVEAVAVHVVVVVAGVKELTSEEVIGASVRDVTLA